MIDPTPERFESDFVITQRNFVDNFQSVNSNYFIWMGVLSLFIIAAGIVVAIYDVATWGFALSATGIVLGVLSSKPVTLWRIKRRAKGTIGTVSHFVIDGSGVEIRHSAGYAHLNWSGVDSVTATSLTMTFRRGSVLWGWIGLDGLDQETRDRLTSFVRAHVSKVV